MMHGQEPYIHVNDKCTGVILRKTNSVTFPGNRHSDPFAGRHDVDTRSGRFR